LKKKFDFYPRLYLERAALGIGLLLIARFVFAIRTDHYYLYQSMTASAGEAEALPPVVFQGLSLTRKHNVHRVRVDPDLLRDPLVRERFIESFYPIRLDSLAPLILSARHAKTCEVIDAKELISLVKCE
jgi:hypothetical protein